jgi:formylglycine-generating enzyme required for sulfatase activity
MEYATRAGALTSRHYGETDELLPKYAWFNVNSQRRTGPVGSLKPNDLGLFDTLGNVLTWCQERKRNYPQFQSAYIEDKEDNYSMSTEEIHPLRGGSFNDYPWDIRCTSRDGRVPTTRNNDVGFRPARTLAP